MKTARPTQIKFIAIIEEVQERIRCVQLKLNTGHFVCVGLSTLQRLETQTGVRCTTNMDTLRCLMITKAPIEFIWTPRESTNQDAVFAHVTVAP